MDSSLARTSPRLDAGAAPTPAQAFGAVLVCRDREGAAELQALAQQALPGATIRPCASLMEVLPAAGPASGAVVHAGVFVFDLRGRMPADFAAELRHLCKTLPEAEVLVVAEAANSAMLSACLQIMGAAARLTFLLAPLDARHAAETIRSVAIRKDFRNKAMRAKAHDRAAIQSLEGKIEELETRLEIARHAARHDDLTGVLNRTGFVEELNTRLDRDRQPQVVMMIDLDRFKAVNDTLGHSAGDDLVRKICVAINSVIPSGGVLARLGGDEFGVIVEASHDSSVPQLCQQILKVCAKSRLISGHEVQVSASIGVAQQSLAHNQVELMRQADLALYAAKREGRNRFRVFDCDLDDATQYRLSIESGLDRALRSGQFRMAYQPIVTAQSGAIQGYEALVRWSSPEYGPISPSEFIPVAEETGLILDIGEWIARQALKDCRRWNGPYVSINLSVRQFLRHNVAERILKYAADADVAPSRIQIELTETAIIDDVERADYNLKTLRNAGVRVALDDFGTGYSSLVYLNQFAIDCIKIDKSFVDNITRDRQSAMIVASVAKLAGMLGMGVVAEGVETEAQRAILIAAGCGSLQGYLFGKPASAKEVADQLRLG